MSMTNSIWNRSLWDLNFILCPHRFPTKPAKKDGESSLRNYQFYWKMYFSQVPNQSAARQAELQISGLSSGWVRIVFVTASLGCFCFALSVLLNSYMCSVVLGQNRFNISQELGHTLTSPRACTCFSSAGNDPPCSQLWQASPQGSSCSWDTLTLLLSEQVMLFVGSCSCSWG